MANILVGVSGGIACYKTCSVVSTLTQEGHDVNVIMTRHAAEFVAPLTFETLIHKPVVSDMFNRDHPWEVEHITLAKAADVCVIAPATANVIAKLATGIADDMLSTTLLAVRCPVIVCPAMNTNMYNNPATLHNLEILRSRGFIICEPGSGNLACGDVGKGRMCEPAEIVAAVKAELSGSTELAGRTFLVTAGGTRENIDGVRYITNRSSGKMGVAIAKELIKRGANVKLITGTVSVALPAGLKKHISVESAEQMYNACMSEYGDCDCIIMAAAVGDYRPKVPYTDKIKGDEVTLQLTKNKDIAKQLGKNKGNRKLVVFCAETGNLKEYAAKKLADKGADMIIANDVNRQGAGFEVDTNIVSVMKTDGYIKDYPLMSKTEVACRIADEIVALW